jgi:DNA-binding NarL/FixJ family response regulator
MSSAHHNAKSLDRILVIDDLPLIPIAFQDVFRSVNPDARVDYSENVFKALSAKASANTTFDLVITDSLQENSSTSLQQAVTELKKRFGQPLIMIYSGYYDPQIIEKMPVIGIDGYVHKYEPIEEILKAYLQLARGETVLSSMFYTLYYQYGYGVRK